MKGKLIVIEGGDGAGKATQLGLLKDYLEKKKLSFATLSFPQYKNTFFGKTIASFLRGDIGELKDMHPYLLSMVYAMDRAEARDKMYKWLNSGKIVALDRYVSSNMAHQTGRLPKKERAKFLRWIDELEYEVNNVPREDIVFYLYVPYKVSQKLLADKKRGKHTAGQERDIVEKDLEYLKNAEEVYMLLYKQFPHWVKINCVNEKGEMRSREEIHSEIVTTLVKKGILH